MVSPVQTPRQGGSNVHAAQPYLEGSTMVSGGGVAVTSIGPLSYTNGGHYPSPNNSPMAELGQWRQMLATRRSQSPIAHG